MLTVAKINDVIKLLVVLSVVTGGLYTGFNWINKVDAIESRLELTMQRLDQKIINDDLRDTQERIWGIQREYFDANGNQIKPMPDFTRDIYMKLIQREKDLQEQKQVK